MAVSTNTITITAVVDIVAALASETLSGNFYMLDTNKLNGSTGIGTENLRTVVKKGDKLIWNVFALECEAYACIDEIIIDRNYCEPERKAYDGTDFVYWAGTVKKDIKVLAYNLKFKLGSRSEAMSALSKPCLVGPNA